MTRREVFAGLACAAVLLAPLPVPAQSSDGNTFIAAVQSVGLRSDQRSVIALLLQSDPQAQDPNVRLDVIDVLEEDQRRRLFAQLHWSTADWSNYQWQNPGDTYMVAAGPILAVVASAQNSAFQLNSNPAARVTLRRGTHIEPTGATIRAGMYVVVYGVRAADGTIVADQIDVLSDGLDLGY
jgi:hypothetical protein